MQLRIAYSSLLVLGLLQPAPAAAPQAPTRRASEATVKSRAPTPAELRARYQKELAKPFITKGGWVLDYDQARARARREDKLIFAYFARSYAY